MKKCLYLISIVLFFSVSALQAGVFKTEKWQTSKGASVVLYQTKELPILDINIAFAAGSAYDEKAFGLSALTTNMMNQGNGHLNTTAVAEKLAETGAQYSAETSRDMTVYRLKTLASEEALKQAVETFALIINKPIFGQDAFNRQKNQLLFAIAQAQQSPDEVANNAFFSKLYQNHPYAHPVNGTVETVKNLNAWQIKQFYKRYYVASNATIVLVGAINTEKAHELAEQITQYLPKGEPAPPIPQAKALTAPEALAIPFPSSQTVLRLGQLGITHKDPDYFPLIVGNYILGGGTLVSRLAHEVRELRGLTYGISSQFVPMPGYGPFVIGLSTKNDTAKTALQITKETLENFLKTGPSDDELTAAKQFLTGSFPLSLASNSSIANMLLRMAFYKLPNDFLDTYVAHIESVTADAIKKAMDEHLKNNQMLLISVGKM